MLRPVHGGCKNCAVVALRCVRAADGFHAYFVSVFYEAAVAAGLLPLLMLGCALALCCLAPVLFNVRVQIKEIIPGAWLCCPAALSTLQRGVRCACSY